MKNNDLISIILPSYNSEKYVAETINSVLIQTYKNFELIIIDDASTDGSMNIINNIAKNESRIKIISLKKNGGVSNARNIGIANAQGKYISFIDSDDVWKNEKLEKQIHFLKANDLDLTFTGYEITFSNTNKEKKKIEVPTKLDYKELLKGNPIACFTVVCKANVFKNILFKKIHHEDYVMWLNLSKFCKFGGLNETLGIYRKHEGSISSNKLKSAQWVWNIYRNEEKLNLIHTTFCFTRYAVKGVLKHIL